MPPGLDYEQVYQFIRQYNIGPDNPYHYDYNGVVHLMLAALDNLRERALETELEEIGHVMDDEQRAFLEKIAGCSRTIVDAEKR